jgi:hypothetical protein
MSAACLEADKEYKPLADEAIRILREKLGAFRILVG